MTQRSLQPEPAMGASMWGSLTTGFRERVLPSGDAAETSRSSAMPGIVAPLARLVPRLLLIGALGLLVATLAIFIFRATFSDRIYPAVVVGDVQVGGMTADDAAARVEARAAELERGTVTFSYNGQTWSPTLSEIGASVDVDASVDAAWELGRDENAVSRLGFTNQLLKDDQVVPLRTTVDRNVLASWFESVNADIDQRAVDANLVVDGTTVNIVPAETGTIVDQDAATAMILESLETLEPMASELPTTVEEPRIVAADLEGEAAQLQGALSSPLVVTLGNEKWDVAPADLAPFVIIDVQSDGGEVSVDLSMDKGQLESYLRETFTDRVNRSPVNAQVAWRDGEGLIALEPSVDGAALRSSAFADVVAEGFLGRSGAVEIPAVITKPEIDSNNLAALNINSRLARGDSNFGGQKWYRDENISVATNYLTGTLVKPGEEFSFNDAIGVINKERGFVESGVIINGRATTGDGGGVCQVSTTVFRATVQAGLPISDWAEHTQRLPIYEQDGWTAGYDASILQVEGADPSEWGDFKFVNDTGGWILIQAWNDYPYNVVEIYGNDDGREVVVSEANVWPDEDYPDDIEVVDESLPAGTMKQTEWPRLGAEASFTMTVTYPDGTVNEQQFYSVYNGNGNVWTVSPDMQGKSPAAN